MMGFFGLLGLLVNLLVVAFVGVWIGSRITDGFFDKAWVGVVRIWRHHTVWARSIHYILPSVIAVACWIGLLLVSYSLNASIAGILAVFVVPFFAIERALVRALNQK